MHRSVKIPDITVHANCTGTYVEQQWQIFLAEQTRASDAAHRVRCLWGQSERWGVSDWWAGDTATSPHMSGHLHSLKDRTGESLVALSGKYIPGTYSCTCVINFECFQILP